MKRGTAMSTVKRKTAKRRLIEMDDLIIGVMFCAMLTGAIMGVAMWVYSWRARILNRGEQL